MRKIFAWHRVSLAGTLILGFSFAVTLPAQSLGEDCANPENSTPSSAELSSILQAHQTGLSNPADGAAAETAKVVRGTREL